MNETNYLLGQKVFQSIREDILSGRYQRQEELREITIGGEQEVSRTPVREALRQLELEGLVTIIPNRGAYVIGISAQDMKEIYEMRSLLEGLCARWAAKNASQEQIDILEETVFLADYYLKRENPKQMTEIDQKFHEILYDAGGSRILGLAMKKYHHYLERARKASLLVPGRAAAFSREHRQIMEAVKERDEEKAEQAAHLHMAQTIKNIDSYGWENITGGQKDGKD